jgi:hypothetical protein
MHQLTVIDTTTLYIYAACQTATPGMPFSVLVNSYPVPLADTNPETSLVHFKRIDTVAYYDGPFALMGSAQVSLGSDNYVGLCQTWETCLAMWFPHPLSSQPFYPSYFKYASWTDTYTKQYSSNIDTSDLYPNRMLL